MDNRPHAPDCFCYKCEAEQFSAARAAKDEADERLAHTACFPSSRRYVCDECHDTGYFGDMGPGRAENNEYVPCDCRRDKRMEAAATEIERLREALREIRSISNGCEDSWDMLAKIEAAADEVLTANAEVRHGAKDADLD